MIEFVRTVLAVSVLAIMAACSTAQSPAASGTTTSADSTMDREAQATLQRLYTETPEAQRIAQQAKGILVFPSVTKAGFLVGGQHGEGVLLENGNTSGYYATTGVSYGLQAGAQTFGYVMFFMNDAALHELKTGSNFEVGMGPSIVIVDEGKAKTLSSTTLNSDIYAFIFSQKGLMAGLGLQGSKITKINR